MQAGVQADGEVSSVTVDFSAGLSTNHSSGIATVAAVEYDRTVMFSSQKLIGRDEKFYDLLEAGNEEPIFPERTFGSLYVSKLARSGPRSLLPSQFTFYVGNPFPRFLRSCFPD